MLGSLNRENLQKHLSRSSSKDQIIESKQMLFNKHLGQEDNAGVVDYMKLNQLNSAVVHDVSDGCISSNYPNSSFSTFRENTFGSFSSMAAAAVVITTNIKENFAEIDDPESNTSSSMKETVDDSDSEVRVGEERRRDYQQKDKVEEKKEQTTPLEENAIEMVDQKRPGKTWGQPNISNVERKFMLQQKRMQEYFKHKDTDKWQASMSTETDMSSVYNNGGGGEADQTGRGKQRMVKPPTPQSPKMRREKSPEKLIKSEIAKDLEPKKLVIPMQEVLKRPAPRPLTAPVLNKFNFVRDTESVASSLKSHVSGVYTNEYLTRARKFGAVVGALRKPGHHVGPAKNPDCLCEHCTRWYEEKIKGRGRANSVTNTPLTFEGFRARRLQQ